MLSHTQLPRDVVSRSYEACRHQDEEHLVEQSAVLELRLYNSHICLSHNSHIHWRCNNSITNVLNLPFYMLPPHLSHLSLFTFEFPGHLCDGCYLAAPVVTHSLGGACVCLLVTQSLGGACVSTNVNHYCGISFRLTYHVNRFIVMFGEKCSKAAEMRWRPLSKIYKHFPWKICQ